MKLSPDDIALLCREITALCQGGRVQRVRDGRPGEVVLRVRVPGRARHVLISAGDWASRIHLTEEPPPGREEPTAFVRLLRKHLIGAQWRGARGVGSDRLAEIELERGPSSDAQRSSSIRLMAELTGRHGNLFLLDPEGRVLGSLRPNVSHRRDLVAGRPYVRPTRPPSLRDSEPTRLDDGLTGGASAVVDRDLSAQIEEARRQRAIDCLERDLRRAQKRLQRRWTHIAADRAQAERAEEYRRWGQLLQAAYGRVERGTDSVRVVDYTDPALPEVDVPLDPTRSLGENVARYFKEAKRLDGAFERIQERLHATSSALERVARALDELSEETRLDRVERQRATLSEEGLLQPRQQTSETRRQPATTKPYQTFRSARGLPILVGRGARHNDQLTLRVARGRDIWLHVDGASGAHVVIRLERGQSPDSESLVDAATLAAHYSQRRGQDVVDVGYTRRRHVRKIKGAPAGQVLVADRKIIAVRVEPDRLERLLASRDDRE